MILRLGQIELFVTDLIRSKEFYVDVLGFIEVERTETSLYLRATDEFDKYTLVLTEKPTAALGSFGLRVSSPEYLEVLQRKHDELGIAAELCDSEHPGKGQILKVAEPNGHPVEFYHLMEQIDVSKANGKGVKALPMRYTHIQKGIPPIRIDHMNLRVPDVDKALKYWNGILGLSVSEYVDGAEGKFAAWTRAKTSTHDVALVKHKETALHHIAYIVDGIAGVVKTADLLADAGYRDSIDYGPGRHGVSNAFFLYIRDPDGHRIEIYAGDYNRDTDLAPIGWTQEDYEQNGRLWWGPNVPDSFFETTPVNPNWMKTTIRK